MRRSTTQRKKNDDVFLAIIISLSIHLGFLAFAYFFNTHDIPEEEFFLLDMDQIELDEPPIDPNDLFLNREDRIQNLIANAAAERTSQSVNYRRQSEASLERDIYDELKELERSTFEELEENRPEEEYNSETETNNLSEDLDNYEWFEEQNQSYGAATVEYELENRDPMNLPPPAYRCKGQGTVILAIHVGQDGVVSHAEVINSTASNDCLIEESIKYAYKSRFSKDSSAPKKQKGKLTYRFVAQ